MCGRYTLAREAREIMAELGVETWEDQDLYRPRYNIAPTLMLPVILPQGGEPAAKLAMLKWGLIPHWARDAKIAGSLVNARSETMLEKPSFRTLVGRRHAVVPADGYYEWQRDAVKKTPFLIHAPDGRLLLLAALWDEWDGGGDGRVLRTFTLLTRAPLPSIARIHDRMPVLLRHDQVQDWLHADAKQAQHIAATVDLPLACHAVSPLVNKVANDSPACRVPVAEEQDLGLL